MTIFSRIASTSLVFVDFAVGNRQVLVDALSAGHEVIVLSPLQGGVEQIAQGLSKFPAISTVSIIANGLPGCLKIGNSELSLSVLSDYAEQIRGWFSSLDQDSEVEPSLHLYGSNVAVGDAGEELISKLQSFSTAVVYASSNKVGSECLGGEWILDYRSRCPSIDQSWVRGMDITAIQNSIWVGMLSAPTDIKSHDIENSLDLDFDQNCISAWEDVLSSERHRSTQSMSCTAE